MSYTNFAYWYDELNSAADYDKLSAALLAALHQYGIQNGIVADLGCGTGEMSIRLAAAGYDVIAVDSSPDMLAVLREKQDEGAGQGILLLLQDLSKLDLYGTIRAAVSTFDTFNHLTKAAVHKALARISLFLEQGGLFLFDVNSPYKHTHILASNTFSSSFDDGLCFVWENSYNAEKNATHIKLNATQNGQSLFSESFFEYAYPLSFWQSALPKCGLNILSVCDGETFAPPTETTQRYLIQAQKS